MRASRVLKHLVTCGSVAVGDGESVNSNVDGIMEGCRWGNTKRWCGVKHWIARLTNTSRAQLAWFSSIWSFSVASVL
ncbi:hypothetical protein Acr_08g0012060 [Actinidia rufa]|uniref:Uncharacterized protein n=1 Tax=Actinidia rufa TaxID=165716 RepID=A0A7J0F2C0_9ERIC|nr:hypothetical protein Acr_08g0012060 [Actinidia rufa]